jgi:hypothetical protein
MIYLAKLEFNFISRRFINTVRSMLTLTRDSFSVSSVIKPLILDSDNPIIHFFY